MWHRKEKCFVGRKRVTNWNAMVDFMRRNSEHVQNCGCETCSRLMEEWGRFSAGQDSRKRAAMDAMNSAVEEHGLR